MAMKNGRPNLEAEYERLHKITHYAYYYTPYIIHEVKHLKAEKIARLLRWFSLFFLKFKTFANRYASADRTPSGRGTSRSAAQLPTELTHKINLFKAYSPVQRHPNRAAAGQRLGKLISPFMIVTLYPFFLYSVKMPRGGIYIDKIAINLFTSEFISLL